MFNMIKFSEQNGLLVGPTLFQLFKTHFCIISYTSSYSPVLWRTEEANANRRDVSKCSLSLEIPSNYYIALLGFGTYLSFGLRIILCPFLSGMCDPDVWPDSSQQSRGIFLLDFEPFWATPLPSFMPLADCQTKCLNPYQFGFKGMAHKQNSIG